MRILVTRPLPGGERSAARLQAHGHKAQLSPLLATEAVAWAPPETAHAAIMLTSAAAARLAGPTAVAYHALPVYTVGAATAAAARTAGFIDIRDGGGTVFSLLKTAAANGLTDILHLAGAHRTPAEVPPGLTVETLVVYHARLMPLSVTPDADWVLLYSPRTAAHFAAECDRLGFPRAAIAIAAVSEAVGAAAGSGWRAVALAGHPAEEALLAAIGATCQKAATNP
ncbi:uroporphyrinogen III methyltransferase [Polymorphobacter glacialis]|uniref:Uroporphyrinogen III methyltransferase n=1 Tax=Sandarakinorhabdus glacialis TaxID=1614636 RepID=A0A917E894_9SPHN|nr:uroporphyrinogen-III synthase [Polymorphobacter glacialis]GGE10449.1 uroporphyrinogen III methyltransferase [Polymorphobacter glacialis]